MLDIMFYPPSLTPDEVERVRKYAISLENVAPRFAEFLEEIALREIHRAATADSEDGTTIIREATFPSIHFADWTRSDIAEALIVTLELSHATLEVQIARLFDALHDAFCRVAAAWLATMGPGRPPSRVPAFPEKE